MRRLAFEVISQSETKSGILVKINKPKRKGGRGGGGHSISNASAKPKKPKNLLVRLESFYFCELGAHAKFWNPMTTPSGFLGTAVNKEDYYQK